MKRHGKFSEKTGVVETDFVSEMQAAEGGLDGYQDLYEPDQYQEHSRRKSDQKNWKKKKKKKLRKENLTELDFETNYDDWNDVPEELFNFDFDDQY